MIKEFECEDCGKIVEVWEQFDEVPTSCLDCGGNINKIISKSSFHLKGSGWYATEYGNKSNKENKNKKQG